MDRPESAGLRRLAQADRGGGGGGGGAPGGGGAAHGGRVPNAVAGAWSEGGGPGAPAPAPDPAAGSMEDVQRYQQSIIEVTQLLAHGTHYYETGVPGNFLFHDRSRGAYVLQMPTGQTILDEHGLLVFLAQDFRTNEASEGGVMPLIRKRLKQL